MKVDSILNPDLGHVSCGTAHVACPDGSTGVVGKVIVLLPPVFCLLSSLLKKVLNLFHSFGDGGG